MRIGTLLIIGAIAYFGFMSQQEKDVTDTFLSTMYNFVKEKISQIGNQVDRNNSSQLIKLLIDNDGYNLDQTNDLLGKDINGNEIRDDLDALLQSKFQNYQNKEEISKIAKAMQDFISVKCQSNNESQCKLTHDKLQGVYQEISRKQFCDANKNCISPEDIYEYVKKVTYNTTNRIEVFNHNMKAMDNSR
ncbi:hypothetical protein [Aquamicrobium sp.]|uniref:hypothetical protein n=1 Tax=Aquamicrobium sp. TaxID=1872579 RepID=UPI0025856BE4|nr:hypothetical protein [Aquamicrobium sp.]MCK9549288.1 hypothetical protein [Aquamicrobium sp.]